MDEKRTFIVPDVHGNLDKLEFLLAEAGIINRLSSRRILDADVIQLGDLAHVGSDNPTGDTMCYKHALEYEWFDTILWGNHDRAIVDQHHQFSGYQQNIPTMHVLRSLDALGFMEFAIACHGYLLTHAGLHAYWKQQPNTSHLEKDDPIEVADYLNEIGAVDLDDLSPREAGTRRFVKERQIIDAIGHTRGGGSSFGGILWRDWTEKIYNGFPQIYGHSARRYIRHHGSHWCLDIGGRTDGLLAGMWLPDLEIVAIDEHIGARIAPEVREYNQSSQLLNFQY